MQNQKREDNAGIHIAAVLKAMDYPAFDQLQNFLLYNDLSGLRNALWEMLQSAMVHENYGANADQRMALMYAYNQLLDMLDVLFSLLYEPMLQDNLSTDYNAMLKDNEVSD